MNLLPFELEAFSALLDAQPAPVREAFQYCLCLMMVETGKMEILQTLPGDTAPLCVFKTNNEETFTIPKPAMSADAEAEIVAALREIMRDEGLL